MNPRPGKLESYREDQVAKNYDGRWQSAAGKRRDLRKGRVLQVALDRIAADSNNSLQSVLDVPFGTGRFHAIYKERGLQVVGADLSLAMLQQARRKTGGGAFLSADLENLPFADQAFDVVVCIRLFHLIRDPKIRLRFLQEVRRVSRVGAVLGWHHRSSFRVWGRHLRHRLGLRAKAPGNPSPMQLLNEIHQAGFPEHHWLPLRPIPFLSDKVLVAGFTKS